MTNSAGAPPLRVLYVVSLFPCWSETFILREIAALLDAGVDVRVVSLKAPNEKLVQPEAAALLDRVWHPLPLLAAARACAAAVLRQPLPVARSTVRLLRGLWRQPRVLAKSLVALTRAVQQIDRLRDFDPQLIHAHWATYPSTAAWLLADLLQRPFGFTCHAHDIFANPQLLAQKIERARLAVTISHYNVDWLAAHATAGAAQKLHLVRCGVDLPALPFRSTGREQSLLLAVGRLDPIKGFDVLIAALAVLARRGITFHCQIVGEGPQRPLLERAIARYALGKQVELTGALPQDQVRALMYRAGVFVLPCRIDAKGNRDGIPVALMEAMAAGTPAISSTVSGVPELIESGCHGLLVAPDDVEALAAAITALLADGDLRQRLAAAARIKVERDHDARREAAKLLALFTEAAQ